MKNNAKTAMLLAGLGGLCMLIGSFWGRGGLVIGLLMGLVFTGAAYWGSDKLAIAAARGQEIGPNDLPEYHRIVADLAQRADIPMPRLYVSQNPQPNAFATGRNPAHAAVCINTGLIDLVPWDEIQGVLAHEISHVKNRDILTGSVAAAIAQGISFMANMAMWGAMFGGGGGNNREGNNPIGGILLIILGPIAAGVIQMAISRSREFEADASAARMLGTGEPLARALERLEVGAQRIPVNVNPAQASAYIVNPLRGKRAGGGLAQMFSTHPPTAERIARLRSGEWR